MRVLDIPQRAHYTLTANALSAATKSGRFVIALAEVSRLLFHDNPFSKVAPIVITVVTRHGSSYELAVPNDYCGVSFATALVSNVAFATGETRLAALHMWQLDKAVELLRITTSGTPDQIKAFFTSTLQELPKLKKKLKEDGNGKLRQTQTGVGANTD